MAGEAGLIDKVAAGGLRAEEAGARPASLQRASTLAGVDLRHLQIEKLPAVSRRGLPIRLDAVDRVVPLAEVPGIIMRVPHGATIYAVVCRQSAASSSSVNPHWTIPSSKQVASAAHPRQQLQLRDALGLGGRPRLVGMAHRDHELIPWTLETPPESLGTRSWSFSLSKSDVASSAC
jgi:hypothetical protein